MKDTRQIKLDLPDDVGLKINVFPFEADMEYDEIRWIFNHTYRENISEPVINEVKLVVDYHDGIAFTCEVTMNCIFPERLGKEFFVGLDISPNAKIFIQFIYEKQTIDVRPGTEKSMEGPVIGGKIHLFKMTEITIGASKHMDLKGVGSQEMIKPMNFPFPVADEIHLGWTGYSVPIPHVDGDDKSFVFPEDLLLGKY